MGPAGIKAVEYYRRCLCIKKKEKKKNPAFLLEVGIRLMLLELDYGITGWTSVHAFPIFPGTLMKSTLGVAVC